MVRIADADAHFARVRAAGARIPQTPKDFEYGERQYTAVDLGGHIWTFSQSIRDVDPAEWGGELVGASEAHAGAPLREVELGERGGNASVARQERGAT